MEYILGGFKEALRLLASFDPEMYKIIFLSILVSGISTIIASLVGIPLGVILTVKNFRFKRGVTRILYTFMGIPPVVVGLIVAIFLSRRGPLGSMELMFTPAAMIIAQSLLVTPIVTGVIFNNLKERSFEIIAMAKTLGARGIQVFITLIKEMRVYVLIAVVSGFGRAISEVGAVMIVGGNIEGHTRVMTSFIAMNNSMGNYSKSIAMGLVLLVIAFLANSILYRFGMGES